MKNIIIILSILFLVACKTTNNNLMFRYESDLRKEKLNGPVKKYKSFKTFNRKGLPEKQIRYYAVINLMGVFPYNTYQKYDTNGLLTHEGSLKDSLLYKKTFTIDNITKEIMYQYKYDTSNFNKKQKYKQQFIPKNVFNPCRLKLNVVQYSDYSIEVRKDSSFKKINHTYKYIFDTKNRVKKEIMYTIWDRNLDGIIDKEILDFTANYEYNDKDQIITKKYDFIDRRAVSYLLDHDLYFSSEDSPPVEKYTYDEFGNLKSVFIYSNKEANALVYSEEYVYNNNELIRLKRRKSVGMQGLKWTDFKRTNELFYNKNGDIIKINTFKNDEKTIHATFLFQYENYDKYNNWLKCNMHLDGIIKNKPTMVIDRLIEYYEK